MSNYFILSWYMFVKLVINILLHILSGTKSGQSNRLQMKEAIESALKSADGPGTEVAAGDTSNQPQVRLPQTNYNHRVKSLLCGHEHLAF